MTKQENQTTEITTTEPQDLQMQEYGSRDDITALARRIRAMLPGGDQLSLPEAMSLAQYAISLDANPFRGEIYAYKDGRGRFHLVDGYKLLVRWARRQAPYSERFDRLTDDELPGGAIGYRCYILRHDARALLQEMIQAGADFPTAYDIATSSAVGVVRDQEMTSRKTGKAINPPAGWTWDQVARKRALKNALNLSHGAPSPREIARETWLVGDVETSPEDWAECTPEMTPDERERTAQLSARTRTQIEELRQKSPEELAQTLEHNRTLLHGDYEQEELL